MNALPAPLRAAVGALGRYRLASRTLAAACLVYSIVLILSGGFEIPLRPMLFRSHAINRFVMVAIVAGMADVLGNAHVVGLAWSLWRRLLAAGARAVPFLLGAAAAGLALALLLWWIARFVDAMTMETPFADMALLDLYTQGGIAQRAAGRSVLALPVASPRAGDVLPAAPPLSAHGGPVPRACPGRRSC